MRFVDALITVCVVTHRRPAQLAQLVGELERCELPLSYAGLTVVDNGGSAESDQIIAAAAPHLKARLLRCGSKMKSSALNLALSTIPTGLLLFIDDDAKPDRLWLQSYHEEFLNKPEGFYFGGQTKVAYESMPPEWLKQFLPKSAIGYSGPKQDRFEAETNFMGFNWAARSQDLIAIGGFSERFGPGTQSLVGDETFAQHQLQRAGIRSRYVPQAIVTHQVPAKNCTREWLQPRVASTGFFQGLLLEQRFREKGRTVPIGAFVLKRIVQRSSFADPLRLLLLRTQGIFWLRFWWLWARGFYRGVQTGRKERPLEKELARQFVSRSERSAPALDAGISPKV